ncbi:hypothetical protein [Streptomyces olivaceus]|uniref:hypothetical protein n=1 Tax=Streptomyces olivaceus TaxID=47716 RepID=UPI004055F651
MTPFRTRGTTVTAATVLALALALGGCGSGAEQPAPTRSSAPAATGTGPYPTPSDAGEAAPLPPGSKGTPRGGVTGPGDVGRKSADAVGQGALTVMWTFDTTIDSGPGDASVRAADAGWLTQAYAARVREHQPRSDPGAQWREWAVHRASTTVTLEKAEDAAIPAETDTEAWRQWAVTASPQGRDGWTGEPTTVVAFVRLARTAADEAWRVADVTVQ